MTDQSDYSVPNINMRGAFDASKQPFLMIARCTSVPAYHPDLSGNQGPSTLVNSSAWFFLNRLNYTCTTGNVLYQNIIEGLMTPWIEEAEAPDSKSGTRREFLLGSQSDVLLYGDYACPQSADISTSGNNTIGPYNAYNFYLPDSFPPWTDSWANSSPNDVYKINNDVLPMALNATRNTDGTYQFIDSKSNKPLSYSIDPNAPYTRPIFKPGTYGDPTKPWKCISLVGNNNPTSSNYILSSLGATGNTNLTSGNFLLAGYPYRIAANDSKTFPFRNTTADYGCVPHPPPHPKLANGTSTDLDSYTARSHINNMLMGPSGNQTMYFCPEIQGLTYISVNGQITYWNNCTNLPNAIYSQAQTASTFVYFIPLISYNVQKTGNKPCGTLTNQGGPGYSKNFITYNELQYIFEKVYANGLDCSPLTPIHENLRCYFATPGECFWGGQTVLWYDYCDISEIGGPCGNCFGTCPADQYCSANIVTGSDATNPLFKCTSTSITPPAPPKPNSSGGNHNSFFHRHKVLIIFLIILFFIGGFFVLVIYILFKVGKKGGNFCIHNPEVCAA